MLDPCDETCALKQGLSVLKLDLETKSGTHRLRLAAADEYAATADVQGIALDEVFDIPVANLDDQTDGRTWECSALTTGSLLFICFGLVLGLWFFIKVELLRDDLTHQFER